MTNAVLGVIGGSGIYDLPGLENVHDEMVESPWGEPSAPLKRGTLAGLPIVFLPRHGKGHVLSPSDINYRANIDALKRGGSPISSRCRPAAPSRRNCHPAPSCWSINSSTALTSARARSSARAA